MPYLRNNSIIKGGDNVILWGYCRHTERLVTMSYTRIYTMIIINNNSRKLAVSLQRRYS